MALSPTQVDYIKRLNLQGQLILSSQGKEGLLQSIGPEMAKIHQLIDDADEGELENHSNQYMGFCAYLSMVEAIAEVSRDHDLDNEE